jgi:hypothetical protein
VTERSRPAGSGAVKPQEPAGAATESVRTPARMDGVRNRADLRLDNRRVQAAERQTQGRVALAPQEQASRTQNLRSKLVSRMEDYRRQRDLTPMDTRTRTTIGGIRTDLIRRRPTYLHARYYDRPDLIRYGYHHTYMYYDPYHRLSYRIIWPTYYYPVCYSFGPYVHFRYVYPYYHRKYVFVSLGGWWPYDYTYMRYYWYGWHPYVWYGYYPIAREVATETNNYYTYNYYTSDGDYTSYTSDTPVDQATWDEVREKLDQQQAEPAAQTLADTRFEEGIKSFEAGNYGRAAEKFAEAMRLAPDDMILPFAYAQALFADEQYSEAANVLRQALRKVSPEKEGVFYPRGLYSDDEVLFAQIEDLVDKLDRFGYDADLQLLLGYHLLGIGETGYARQPLERAGQDMENVEAAGTLLKLLEKIESEAGAAGKADTTSAPDANAGEVTVAPVDQTQTTTRGAQLSSTPDAGATAAPGVQVVSPSSDVNGAEDDTAAPDKSDAAGVQKVGPSSGNGDDGGAPPVLRGDAGSAADDPVSPDTRPQVAGVAWRPRMGLAIAWLKDFAGLVLMMSLGCVAVYVQWRHVDDNPLSLSGHGK